MSILLNVVLVILLLALVVLVWRAHKTNVDAWELLKQFAAWVRDGFGDARVK